MKSENIHNEVVVVDIYIRVSTLEQAEEGFSVEAQESKLRNYCDAMGYKIHAIRSDPGYSGSSINRPGIRKLIDDVKSRKVSKVIVWKLDRLSRSQKDILVLLEDVFLSNDCNFVSLIESFDTSTAFGRAIVGILAAFAQLEMENIRERTSMGRHARIKKGYYHASNAPIGYKFKPGSNELVIDEKYALVVTEIFNMFLDGESIHGIYELMNLKYGSERYVWNQVSLKRILRNVVYTGKTRLGNNIYQGLHEPIISDDIFDKANKILTNNKSINKRNYSYKLKNGKSDNLLAGLLFCGDCGARMYCKNISKTTKKYICHSVARSSKPMIKSDNCTNRLHPFTSAELEEIVIREITRICNDDGYVESISEIDDDSSNEIEAYTERIVDIESQIERIMNLFQRGIVDIDEISDRITILKKEKIAIQELIDNESINSSQISLNDAILMAKKISDANGDYEEQEVHSIVHSLVKKIIVLNDKVTVYWTF